LASASSGANSPADLKLLGMTRRIIVSASCNDSDDGYNCTGTSYKSRREVDLGNVPREFGYWDTLKERMGRDERQFLPVVRPISSVSCNS
jgi:hypothetical protein